MELNYAREFMELLNETDGDIRNLIGSLFFSLADDEAQANAKYSFMLQILEHCNLPKKEKYIAMVKEIMGDENDHMGLDRDAGMEITGTIIAED